MRPKTKHYYVCADAFGVERQVVTLGEKDNATVKEHHKAVHGITAIDVVGIFVKGELVRTVKPVERPIVQNEIGCRYRKYWKPWKAKRA